MFGAVKSISASICASSLWSKGALKGGVPGGAVLAVGQFAHPCECDARWVFKRIGHPTGSPAQPAPAQERYPALRTGAQILCEALVRQGVDVIFGIPGGAGNWKSSRCMR